MIDHAFLFTEIVYSYLPKSCIPIYRSRVFLITENDVLLITDYKSVMLFIFIRMTDIRRDMMFHYSIVTYEVTLAFLSSSY